MKIPVYLNVYDLHHANSYGYFVGLGAFHSGVEIGDKEYAFGGHEYNFTGVYESTPRVVVGAAFRESILLGETSLTRTEIQNILNELSLDYVGVSYHPIKRNCNAFSNDLSLRLLNKPIPSYVNRLAYFGSFMTCIPVNTLLSIVGFTPPTADVSTNTKESDETPFFGTGYSLTASGEAQSSEGNEIESEESEEMRRERAASAAYKRLNKSMI